MIDKISADHKYQVQVNQKLKKYIKKFIQLKIALSQKQ